LVSIDGSKKLSLFLKRNEMIVCIEKFIKNKGDKLVERCSLAEVCTVCGLPEDLCVCGELEKEQTRIIVRLEMRRYGKPTTLIEGLDPKHLDINNITKKLKRKLACGGSTKNSQIILQGDHRDVIKDYLIELGFNPDSIEVQ
jgi:translation initiation factor 1